MDCMIAFLRGKSEDAIKKITLGCADSKYEHSYRLCVRTLEKILGNPAISAGLVGHLETWAQDAL